MAVVLEEKADGKNIHVTHLSESSNANNENETKQQTSIPTIDEANDNASTTPLFIQSEFDLRSIKIAAETAKQQNHLAIQSHPNLSETSSCEYSAIDESLTRETNSDQSNLNLNGSEGDKNNAQKRENSVSIDPRINSHRGRIRNQSELEINDQHVRIQKHYKKEQSGRRRRLTDIDFEGILKIIGGCSTWQILIYLMISVHQVPHAMSRSIYQSFIFRSPQIIGAKSLFDYLIRINALRVKVPVFSREYIENPENEIGSGWTWEKALDSGIAFPQVRRHGRFRHDQCFIYKIPENHFREYIRMNFTAALLLARERPRFEVERCKEWEYDRSESIVTQWHRVCDENWSRAHVHLSYSLGYLVGCLMGGYISDRYGRKPAIYGFSILSTIFGFLLSFSREFEVFLIVRFLLAACNEAADLAAYVYCMEITGVQYRSIVGSMLQAPWACGYAFLALVAYLCRSWTSIQLITSSLYLLALFFIHYLPERYNNSNEAEKIIRKACHYNKSSLPSDLELVRHAEMRKWIKQNSRPHFLHSFKSRAMAFRNAIIFVVWIATALVYYGIVIALSDQSTPGRAMFVGNFFLNNAIAGAIELPTLMFCVFLLHSGRKRSQVITLISSGILIFIAMCLSIREEMTFSLLFLLAGKACIQGAFNILYIFTSELYPTIIRNSAVGTCSMVARFGSAASGYIAILSDMTLPIVPMAIFCVFSLFAGVLIYFLPETRDLPLPDTMWDAIMLKNTQGAYRRAGSRINADTSNIIGGDDDNEDGLLYTNISKR